MTKFKYIWKAKIYIGSKLLPNGAPLPINESDINKVMIKFSEKLIEDGII